MATRSDAGGCTTHRHRISLRPPQPFELPLVLFGHGWIDLAPHVWDGAAARWTTTLDVAGTAVDVAVRARGDALAVMLAAPRRLARRDLGRARAMLRRMLRLDERLEPFWQRCAATPHLRWAARRGGGRLLASATLFEDLVRLLCTTNCTWAATRAMVGRLVAGFGRPAPSGSRTFPDPATLADLDEPTLRGEARLGYRAVSLQRLARRFAGGDLAAADFEDPELPTEAVRARVLALPGFGPYAAGQALRLLGRYDDLALDSWCRRRLAERSGRARPPADRTVARRYARFRPYQGLALWLELTARWHGEGDEVASGPGPLAARR